jgi:CBS domain-containing protein
MDYNKKAAQVMNTDIVTTTPDLLLTDAIQLMLDHSISSLPVVDEDGMLLGFITEYDIINFAISGEADRTRVKEAMALPNKVVSFSPETDLETMANCFVTQRIHRVPIISNGKVVGMVSRRDILREILRIYRKN